MQRTSFQAVSPAGLVIDAVTAEVDRLLIVTRPVSLDAACPECGRRSGQVHSRYDRRLMDLPSHGRAVHLRVRVRRFRCGNAGCPRMIFGEPLATAFQQATRLGANYNLPYAQRRVNFHTEGRKAQRRENAR